MTGEMRYYRAAGRSLAIIEQYIRDREDAFDAAEALQEEVGATGYVRDVNFGRIHGFRFDGQPPEQWKRTVRRHACDEHEYWMPKRNSATRKELLGRIASAGDLGSSFGLGRKLIGGLTGVGIAKYGDDWYISVGARESDVESPPDAVPVKASEYYAAKERYEESAVREFGEVEP